MNGKINATMANRRTKIFDLYLLFGSDPNLLETGSSTISFNFKLAKKFESIVKTFFDLVQLD